MSRVGRRKKKKERKRKISPKRRRKEGQKNSESDAFNAATGKIKKKIPGEKGGKKETEEKKTIKRC